MIQRYGISPTKTKEFSPLTIYPRNAQVQKPDILCSAIFELDLQQFVRPFWVIPLQT